MGQKMVEKAAQQPSPVSTKKELREYIAEIEQRIVDRSGADVAALVALNQILRMPNASELIDGEVRNQIKDLWIKLKAAGVAVDDPPILFGLPADFAVDETADEVPEVEADVPTVSPTVTTAPSPKKKQEKPVSSGEDLPH